MRPGQVTVTNVTATEITVDPRLLEESMDSEEQASSLRRRAPAIFVSWKDPTRLHHRGLHLYYRVNVTEGNAANETYDDNDDSGPQTAAATITTQVSDKNP